MWRDDNTERHGLVFGVVVFAADKGEVDDDQKALGVIVEVDARPFFFVQRVAQEFGRQVDFLFHAHQLRLSRGVKIDPAVGLDLVNAFEFRHHPTIDFFQFGFVDFQH